MSKKKDLITQKQPNITSHADVPPLGALSTPTSSIRFFSSIDFVSITTIKKKREKEM